MNESQAAPTGAFPVPGLRPPTQKTGAKRRIGDVIVQLGFAERELVEDVVDKGRANGIPLGQALIDAKIVDSNQLAQALAERNGLDYVDLNSFEVDQGAANLIDAGKARRYQTIPISFLGEQTVLVATADPANVLALDDIAMATGYEVRRAVASPEDIEALISQLSRLGDSVEQLEEEAEASAAEVIELRDQADEAPVVKLVHSVIADAVRRGASDIHFEPRPSDMRVRYRVDGVVIDTTTVPRQLVAGLISRVKIMANLDIAEKRVPQDGRIGLSVDGRHIDLRVATLPVVRGESIVMRILDKDKVVMDLDVLGMEEHDRDRFDAALKATNGAILVTGPTGSGKTTTLYAALSTVNTADKTIITIEDPVEYELTGVKQVQVNPKTGLSFAAGLRSMVRADPDVIMVGEVRDRDTAQIAIESALTGHLVLTTLHTNDAPLAVARLVEMGIEPYLVSSGVECVVAQRLVRRLCECKTEAKLSQEVLEGQGFECDHGFTAYEPAGCVRCNHSGYKGRLGIYELMVITEGIRRLILETASADQLRAQARSEGMRTLRQDGLEKIQRGVTSVAEVLRVTGTAAG
ncbi:MAG: type pilus assembly protein PilB [Thermoleophilaceae bacterium]|jgi:type IV pilus assembly protein PilB|nr:type pilus assembly protein PilB [Thermoleophilaceae bacterium]